MNKDKFNELIGVEENYKAPDKLMLLAQGISRYNISKNKVMEMLVPVPEIVEQQKIGAFFKQLDDTIVLHQRKLDLLKEQKKGFLQNMFA